MLVPFTTIFQRLLCWNEKVIAFHAQPHDLALQVLAMCTHLAAIYLQVRGACLEG